MEKFNTGSQRDTQAGKLRYDLIPPDALARVAHLYAWGAEKYGDRNWELGQPAHRVYASLLRHVYAYRNGDKDEDHLAAVVFNALALMAFEERGMSLVLDFAHDFPVEAFREEILDICTTEDDDGVRLEVTAGVIAEVLQDRFQELTIHHGAVREFIAEFMPELYLTANNTYRLDEPDA